MHAFPSALSLRRRHRADPPPRSWPQASPGFWSPLGLALALGLALVPIDNAPAAEPAGAEVVTTGATAAPAALPPEGEATAKSYLADMVLIPSEFDATFRTGKDPFFPKSTRRGHLVKPEAASGYFLPELELKGISVSPTHRMALINKYTIAEGEERLVRVDDQTYRVRCLEVRERSVVIGYRNQKRELFLKPNL